MQKIGKYGKRDDESISEVSSDNRLPANSDSLYYGRMYFPASRLEGMFIRRASPAWQYVFSFVTDPHPGRGSAVSYLSYSTDSDYRSIPA